MGGTVPRPSTRTMVLCTWKRGSRVRCAPRQLRPGRAARAAGSRTCSFPNSLPIFGKANSTISHRATHDNTAALLHSTSCGQIELRICTVPAEALTPLSRFPFRAQTGHEARAIPVGRPCQDGGLGNENFDPDLAPPLFPRSQPCTRGRSRTQSRSLSSSFDRKRQLY